MSPKHILTAVFTVVLIAAISCTSSDKTNTELPENVQAVSLLGDTLYTEFTELPENMEARIDSLIDEAEADNDDIATMLIWQARKLGYQGEYRRAVATLTSAISSYPDDARLYRHRGHRYITLREFEHAIADFEEAARLEKGKEDRIEPAGSPNPQNIPVSTLQTNIWYHLGLAYYLKGDYAKAQNAYENGLQVSPNNDMDIATKYWLYMTLRKQGKDEEAGKLINTVSADTELIENEVYLKALLVFKCEFCERSLLDSEATELNSISYNYGLGFWHAVNGRTEKATEIWQQVYDTGYWAPFGFIAAEAELARMK